MAPVVSLVLHPPHNGINKAPSAHVLWLFLHPYHLLRIRVTRHDFVQSSNWERVQLLYSNYCNICTQLVALGHHVPRHLARAQHNARHLRLVGNCWVVQNFFKAASSEIRNWRTAFLHAQWLLGRHDH